MRKTSHDGGDSTSITSGIENEIKKSGAIIKTKRTSIKRKVQNFSLESDDAVIEPLLQKDKEKADTSKQGAKFNLMSKTKTEIISERGTDKLKSDDKSQNAALSIASDITDRALPTSNVKENSTSKISSANAPLHNHMNTNVFNNHDGLKTYVAPKSQILVEIDGSKHVGYNPSPLIFTTAKIHTDGKTKHMEPVQMTPVPILSTIEVSVMKSGINTGETSGHVTSNISAVYIPQSNNNITEQDLKLSYNTVNSATNPPNKVADAKNKSLADKRVVKSNTLDKSTTPSTSNKETKFTQPNFSSISVQDASTDNKCINIENKIEKAEYYNKTPTSQAMNPTTFEENKNTIPQGSKSGAVSVANTIGTKNYIKDTGLFNQTKQVKPDARLYSENKIDLKSTDKTDSLELERSKPSDKVNNSDKANKEKNKEPNLFSTRQLQRQNVVLDKDDLISKIKPNVVSPTLSNNSKGIDESRECQKSSTVELNILSDKTKLPKSSANNFSITSVTSVSTNTSATDTIINVSITSAAALNKQPTTITSNAAVNQIACTVVNSSVTNNTYTAITTISVPANKSSFPTTSSALKTFDPIPTTSNVKNMSAEIKISAPITTAVVMKNTFVPVTIAAAKSIAIFSPSTTTTAGIKQYTPSCTATAENEITSPSSNTTVDSKISASSTITAVDKNKSTLTTSTAAGNKMAIAANKISSPSTTTTVTATTTDNEKSTRLTTTTASNKTPSPSTTTTIGNKISSPSTTTAAGNKISIFSTTGNKIANPIITTATTNKTSSPIITTAATKLASGCKTTTSGVNKTSTSNSNSSNKPTINLSSNLSTVSNSQQPVTKPTIVTTSLASKPFCTEKYSSNESTSRSSKSGPANETSTTKSQPTSTLNTKPTTTKPAKVTIMATPATSSQRTTVVKSPKIITAKSAPTKTISQPNVGKSTESAPTKTISHANVGKSTEITPKSSTNNEKPLTVKSNSTSISATTTSGISNVTPTTASVTSSTLVSSGSSSQSVVAPIQRDSKSKVIGNGSKNFKA